MHSSSLRVQCIHGHMYQNGAKHGWALLLLSCYVLPVLTWQWIRAGCLPAMHLSPRGLHRASVLLNAAPSACGDSKNPHFLCGCWSWAHAGVHGDTDST